MFWRFVLPRYAFKNFKQQMKIQQNSTLKGLIRRFARKYPKTYRGFQKVLLLCTTYTVSMTLIPGSQLPFQKTIKIKQLNITGFFSKLWFYNMFTPSGADYLIKLNELILSAMDSQVFEMAVFDGMFKEIEWLVGLEKKSLRKSNYFDLLLYSELILQNIVRFQNRLLLEPSLQNYYSWIYETVFPQIQRVKVTPKQEKHIKMFYAIIQYILNYGRQEQVSKCLLMYQEAIEQANKGKEEQFCHVLAKRAFSEQQFLDLLKNKYAKAQSQEIKQAVIAIFEKLDKIYNQVI